MSDTLEGMIVGPRGSQTAEASSDLLGELDQLALELEKELIEFRRDLHRHPELSLHEVRTSQRIASRLGDAGLNPKQFPNSGLVCDLPGGAPGDPVLALRADIDALPVADEKAVAYRSTVPNTCHACGHDVHTSAVLGAGLMLARLSLRHPLPVPVRLIFQPAEEVLRGAPLAIEEGALQGVGRILGMHCDPRLEVGQIGLRTGPITSACDLVRVTATGPGGHSSRPHLTSDLVFALATLVTGLPGAVSRRLDPRAGAAIVWGHFEAGRAHNAIPTEGFIEGTVRCMDAMAWKQLPDLVQGVVDGIASTLGVEFNLEYTRGVPPLVNDHEGAELLRRAVTQALGPDAAVPTDQSLGGEDFAWYLEHVPGAMMRLGVRVPGRPQEFDLHQGSFDADERAIGYAARILALTPYLA